MIARLRHSLFDIRFLFFDLSRNGTNTRKPRKYRNPPIVNGPISLSEIFTKMNVEAHNRLTMTASITASR